LLELARQPLDRRAGVACGALECEQRRRTTVAHQRNHSRLANEERLMSEGANQKADGFSAADIAEGDGCFGG